MDWYSLDERRWIPFFPLIKTNDNKDIYFRGSIHSLSVNAYGKYIHGYNNGRPQWKYIYVSTEFLREKHKNE